MMKVLLRSFLLGSALFHSNILYSEECSYSDVHEIKMPPLRLQDNTGFCYGFTPTALIQYLYCKKKVHGCKFSATSSEEDDRLSVFDVLGGDHQRFTSDKNKTSIQLLNIIKTRGSLAKESCAPFDSFTNDAELNHLKNGGFFELNNILNDLQDPFFKKKIDICNAAEKIRNVLPSLPGITNIQKILQTYIHSISSNRKDFMKSYASLGEAVKALSLPEKCTEARIPIPTAFTIKTFAESYEESSFSKNEVLEKYISLLSKNIPVGAELCQRNSCGLYGAHVLTVTGYRTKSCKGEKNVIQLKLYDSAGGDVNGTPMGQPWADYHSFFQSQDSLRESALVGKQYEASHPDEVSFLNFSAPMFWIEE
jgi:hypothetical protein